jgi:osmoprotectant transport system substrate-binding protein
MNEADLFRAFADEKNPVTMVTATLTDGHLTQPAWKALRDDRQVFAPAEAVILVRGDVLTAEPNLAGALSQLTGKISLDRMRQLNARVVVDERPVAEVAAEFLNSAGLN